MFDEDGFREAEMIMRKWFGWPRIESFENEEYGGLGVVVKTRSPHASTIRTLLQCDHFLRMENRGADGVCFVFDQGILTYANQCLRIRNLEGWVPE